jgi:hypothetical protein
MPTRCSVLLSSSTIHKKNGATEAGLDDFLGGVRPKPDDLAATDFGIDVTVVLGDIGEKFLTTEERNDINKGAAHLTKELSPDPDSEVGLKQILKRSMPVLSRLVAGLRAADASQEAKHWLDKTDELIKRGEAL